MEPAVDSVTFFRQGGFNFEILLCAAGRGLARVGISLNNVLDWLALVAALSQPGDPAARLTAAAQHRTRQILPYP